MATHSSILAWEIPWTEEGLNPWGHKRAGHNLVTKHQQIGYGDYSIPSENYTEIFLSLRKRNKELLEENKPTMAVN